MGEGTIKVQTWNVGSILRERFSIPAADAGDVEAVMRLSREIGLIKERVAMGDTAIYSEVLGCWIKVVAQ